MEVSSVLFPRSQWGLQMAKLWIRENGYALEHGVDMADPLYYRVRQTGSQKGGTCQRKLVRSRTYGTDVVLLLRPGP